MLKEIHEQADAVAETIADRTVRPDGVDLPELDDELLRGAKRIIIVACGTSYHAGLIGRYAIEEWARVPVEMDIASEYRYRNPVVGPGDLVIGITQSGETLDTLAAMRLARERGATVLAVTNIMGSQATRDADGVVYTRAGLEIGVAATKTFVAQVAVMYLLALRIAELKGTLPRRAPHRARRPSSSASRTTSARCSSSGTEAIDRVAERHYKKDFFLYLGRHVGLPVGLEGALKLKEISYIATDAYAAGEMKHGPIALLDQDTPVVVVATDSPVLDKVISNMQEVRVRGAHVIAVASEGTDLGEHAEETLEVPRDRLDAPAAAGGHPAAAAGLPDRAPARPERRPAAQPRQDRHRRVALRRVGRGGGRPQAAAELLGGRPPGARAARRRAISASGDGSSSRSPARATRRMPASRSSAASRRSSDVGGMSPVAVPTTTASGRSSTASRSASSGVLGDAGDRVVADAGQDRVGAARDPLDDDDRRDRRLGSARRPARPRGASARYSVRCAAAACWASVGRHRVRPPAGAAAA